jgi:hypothetical protein
MQYNPKEQVLAKVELALDQPSKVLIINKQFLLAIEKNCITLYRIHNQHLIIKDFDSIGIGNQLIVA